MVLEKEIKRYSKLNGFPISEFNPFVCSCGHKEFELFSDDDEGGAYVVCSSCGLDQDLENSRRYIENNQQNVCNCDNADLNIGIGKAFHSNSNDVSWVYVGAHCNKCDLSGVYVDWKQN